MSIEEENKALIQHFFEKLNKGNLSVSDELCAPEYVYHGTNGCLLCRQHSAVIFANPNSMTGAYLKRVVGSEKKVVV
jgi:hypothetical protein